MHPELEWGGVGKETRVHDKDGENTFGGVCREEQESHFSCSKGMGETKREMVGGKNMIMNLMLGYELEVH